MITFNDLPDINDIRENGYVKIKNHGMIANNRTAAIIAMDGTIDWACFPNFNSKPIFDSILDKNKGGFFSIRPVDDVFLNQYYEEFTNILITEFLKNHEVILRITDFLPISDYSTINYPEIHRFIEAPNSDVDIDIKFRPNFNYGMEMPMIERSRYGYLFIGSNNSVGISSNFKFKLDKRNTLSTTVELSKGSYEWIVVAAGIKYISPVSNYKSYDRLEETREYWKKWSNSIDYHGVYHKYVLRSALALKGLFYDPTGLMVAAPTSSLPESIGGERNWDYRYTWIRDTAYVIEALSFIGLKREATKFLYDIMDTIEKENRLRTIYSIDHDYNELFEDIINYDGYMDSKPVRMGNRASEQLQVDQYGSIINALYHLNKIGGAINSYMWDFVIDILEKLSIIWKYPDSSIWEFRTEPRHYVYSKLMSWAAFDRAIRMGKDLNYTAPYNKWRMTANEIKKDIIKNGFNKELNSFVQYYGSNDTDASLLRIPLLNFLPVNHPMVQGTISLIEKNLMHDNYLFKRYNEDDGLKGDDNAFLLLSFWYVEDLILMNRIKDAKNVLDRLLNMSNHLMLFSEEIDFKTLEPVGNFPQAITHLGVIRAITKLNNAFKKIKNRDF